MSEQSDELKEFLQAVGPRRVKTKEMEIETHSIHSIQKFIERQKSKPVTLSQFPKTLVRPKNVTFPCIEEYE